MADPAFYEALLVAGDWAVVNTKTGNLVCRIDPLGAPLTKTSALRLARDLNAARLNQANEDLSRGSPRLVWKSEER